MVIHSSFYLLFIHSHLLLFGCSVIAQSGLTLCDPMVYTVHGILQARILEWVAFSFSRGSSQPRDLAQVSHIAGGFFLYQLSHRGSQGILKWVVDPFSHRLSDPGFEPWFSVVQADSLPTELSEKPFTSISSVQSLSHVWLFVTPRTAVCQASLSITNFQSLLKFISIETVMKSNHLILCHPLLLCLQSFPASGSFQMSPFFV